MATAAIPSITTAAVALNGSAGTRATWWKGERSSVQAGTSSSAQPDLRSNLLATRMIGLGMIRYVLRFEPLASAKPAEVVAWVGPAAQRYLTGKLA